MTKKATKARATPPLHGWVWLVAATVPWIIVICTQILLEGRKAARPYAVQVDGAEIFFFLLYFMTFFTVLFLDGPPARLQAHFSAREVVAGRWRIVGPKWSGPAGQLGAVGLVSLASAILITRLSSRHAISLTYLMSLGVILFCNRWRLTPPATIEVASTGYRGHGLRLHAGATERPVELLRANAARGELHLRDGARTGVWFVLGPSDDLFALADELAAPPQTPEITTRGPKR